MLGELCCTIPQMYTHIHSIICPEVILLEVHAQLRKSIHSSLTITYVGQDLLGTAAVSTLRPSLFGADIVYNVEPKFQSRQSRLSLHDVHLHVVSLFHGC